MSIFIDRWLISKPADAPDKDGNTVLISKKSFGPLEIWEWGLNADNEPYELYKWLENDFYEEASYCKNITKEELLDVIYSYISYLEQNNYHSIAELYDDVIERVKSL